MFLHVTQAKYLHDYVVEVQFNDGRTGCADLKDALEGPIFEPLKDVQMFSKLHVDPGLETIVWPNGADMAPEFIFFQAFKADQSLQKQFKSWGYLG